MNEIDMFHELRPQSKNIIRNLNYWRKIADNVAEKYQKQFIVTENIRGEYGVFPASSKIHDGNEIIYITRGDKRGRVQGR